VREYWIEEIFAEAILAKEYSIKSDAKEMSRF
jgi:hypothetical protein